MKPPAIKPRARLVSVPRFVRTDPSDGSSEVLTLVELTSGRLAGETFASAELEGREYPYLVQVTSGPDPGDDFDGLFDLDGDRIDVMNSQWSIVTEAPAEVVEQIEFGWEYGNTVVARLEEEE